MTNYLVVNSDLSDAEVTSTKASGPQLHILDEGPTVGLKFAYSGEVTGIVTYLVDNGPSFGIGRSTT